MPDVGGVHIPRALGGISVVSRATNSMATKKDAQGFKTRVGTTPGGRPYVAKKSPAGDKNTEIVGKRSSVVKSTAKGGKPAIKAFRNKPNPATTGNAKAMKKGPTKKAKK